MIKRIPFVKLDNPIIKKRERKILGFSSSLNKKENLPKLLKIVRDIVYKKDSKKLEENERQIKSIIENNRAKRKYCLISRKIACNDKQKLCSLDHFDANGCKNLIDAGIKKTIEKKTKNAYELNLNKTMGMVNDYNENIYKQKQNALDSASIRNSMSKLFNEKKNQKFFKPLKVKLDKPCTMRFFNKSNCYDILKDLRKNILDKCKDNELSEACLLNKSLFEKNLLNYQNKLLEKY